MKDARIFSYMKSQKISEEDLKGVSGAGYWTSYMSAGGSYGGQSGPDAHIDVSWDF